MVVRPRASRRATSLGVARALQDALTSGKALTYTELAHAAACNERTVRNYVDDAPRTLGFEVERVRGTDRAVRVRRVGGRSRTPRIEELGRVLAGELLRNVFPVAGTDLQPSKLPASKLVVVSTRGAYEYGERHLRALRQWLQFASEEPRRAVQFAYDGAENGIATRIAWPIGMVLKDAARVFLAGVDGDALDGRDVRTYALESLIFPAKGSALALVSASDTRPLPPRFAEATIAEAIDAPFSMFRPTPERSVRVRVAFGRREARYVVNRRWHRRQRVTQTPDGGVVLELGPVDRDEVMAWIRSWGDGARLVEMSPAKTKKKE
jgi:hypothetical protein